MGRNMPVHAEEQVRANNNRFFDSSELNGWLRCEVSERFSIQYINDFFVRILGFDSREELLKSCGGSYAALCYPGDSFDELARESRALPVDGNMDCDYRLGTKSGGAAWIRAFNHKYIDSDGTPMLLCLCIDMTEQKVAEEALKIRGQEYSLAIANSGKLVYRYTLKDRAIDISPEAAALFGYPARMTNVPESLLATGKVAPESAEALREFYARIDSGEKTGGMIGCRRINDGSYRWFDMRFSTVFNEEGAPVSAIILFEDVTDEREEHIVSALDRERLMVALKSVYPVSLSVNMTKGQYRTLGGGDIFTRMDDAAGDIDTLVREGAKRMLPEYANTFAERFSTAALRERFAAGAAFERMEYRQRAFDGQVHWLECVAFHIDNAYDADENGIILIRFIDEQKAAEEKLQQALEITSEELSRERLYQKLMDASTPVGTLLVGLGGAGTLLHVGGTMLADLGYTLKEYEAFQRDHLKGFVYEEDYGTAFQDMWRQDVRPVPNFEQEFRVVKKDGSILWMYEKGTLVQLDGEPAYIIVCIDISRRKEMEERLRVSEEEMNLAMSKMGKMVCLYDVATRTLTLPETYAKKHGLPAVLHGVPQDTERYGVFSNAGRVLFSDFYEAILRGEKTGEAESCLHCADGTWRWEHAEFVTIFSSDGNPVKAIVSVEDTTLLHEKEDETEALLENARMFEVVAAHSNRFIFRYDIATRTAYAANAEVAKRAHISPVNANLPESVIDRGGVLPESIDDFRQVFSQIDEGRREGSAKLHMRIAEGKTCWVDMRYSLIGDAEGRYTAAVLSCMDITDEHERELAYERYRQDIAEDERKESIVYFETDLTADVVEKRGGNVPFLAFPESGCRHEDAVGYGIENLITAEARARAWKFFSRSNLITAFADGTRSLSEDWPVILPGEQKLWFRAEIQMVQDPYSGHIKVYTILRDVTQEKLAALTVQRQAEMDGMTGIYNKLTTETLVRERLQDKSGQRCTLLIADLDNLKGVNDNLGHAQGDKAIRLFAETLRTQFRHTDIVGRIGGDEFMAFLDGAGDETMIHSMMTALMRRLAALRIGEHNDVHLRGSIGITVGTMGEDDFDMLYRQADRALYHVKRNGKNDYAFYTPDMEETAYQYKGHDETALWRAEAFDATERDRLLYAISEIYPLVISVNLTQNSYYMMQYNHFATTACFDAGVFDELIREGAETFAKEDRDSFLRAFQRESLLAAHARGERGVSHVGRQLGDDGVYRRILTNVIFVPNADGDDVLEITLSREVETTVR